MRHVANGAISTVAGQRLGASDCDARRMKSAGRLGNFRLLHQVCSQSRGDSVAQRDVVASGARRARQLHGATRAHDVAQSKQRSDGRALRPHKRRLQAARGRERMLVIPGKNDAAMVGHGGAMPCGGRFFSAEFAMRVRTANARHASIFATPRERGSVIACGQQGPAYNAVG